MNSSTRTRRVAAGLCIGCGKVPPTRGLRCEICAEKHREYTARNRVAWHSGRLSALAEQARIDRESRRFRVERIVKAAKADPDLSLEMLGERFGMSVHGIHSVLRDNGVSLQGERLVRTG